MIILSPVQHNRLTATCERSTADKVFLDLNRFRTSHLFWTSVLTPFGTIQDAPGGVERISISAFLLNPEILGLFSRYNQSTQRSFLESTLGSVELHAIGKSINPVGTFESNSSGEGDNLLREARHPVEKFRTKTETTATTKRPESESTNYLITLSFRGIFTTLDTLVEKGRLGNARSGNERLRRYTNSAHA